MNTKMKEVVLNRSCCLIEVSPKKIQVRAMDIHSPRKAEMERILRQEAGYQPPEIVFLHMHGVDPAILKKVILRQKTHTPALWVAWSEFTSKPADSRVSYMPSLGSLYFRERKFFQKMVFEYFNDKVKPITFGEFQKQTALIHELSMRHGWTFRDFRKCDLTPEKLWEIADLLQQANAHPGFLKPENFKELAKLPQLTQEKIILHHWKIQDSFSPSEAIEVSKKIDIHRLAEAVERRIPIRTLRNALARRNPAEELEKLMK